MEGDGEKVRDGLHEGDAQSFSRCVGHVGEVFFVALGEYDGFDSGVVSGEDFFLDSADWEDAAAECDLSGHGEVGSNGSLGEEADE